MLQARDLWRRVQRHSHGLIWKSALVLVFSLIVSPTHSTAATVFSPQIRAFITAKVQASPARHPVVHQRPAAPTAELADFTSHATASQHYVVSLIHQDFPANAWHDAEAVAWCESKFRTTDIGFDSNGTHDRGVFQLNDGGTEEYLMAMIGQNPKNLSLAFNPVLNVRAAALLYSRDGWKQWSCASAI